MKRLSVLLLTLIPFLCSGQTKNYLEYHTEISKAEEFIVTRQFNQSLEIYRMLQDKFEHMFLRDIKVAAQLAAYSNDTDNLFYFLEKGMKKGWASKEIMKMKMIEKYKNDTRWEKLKANKDQFKKEFESSINLQLRTEIKDMFKEDQKRAIRVALTPIKKWRDSYTNRKFVPNNRTQVRRINQIIDQLGYPGEKIIGDKSWATVIISHNEHDTIYNQLRPKLYSAFERGELSAIDLAIIETWRIVVDTDRKEKGFIIWGDEITKSESINGNSLRQSIGLRSIELNNKLIQTEKELDMKFYLSPFHGGLITIKE
jgi:hypothetical protein